MKLIYAILSELLLVIFIVCYWLHIGNPIYFGLGIIIIFGTIWLDKKVGFKFWRI